MLGGNEVAGGLLLLYYSPGAGQLRGGGGEAEAGGVWTGGQLDGDRCIPLATFALQPLVLAHAAPSIKQLSGTSAAGGRRLARLVRGLSDTIPDPCFVDDPDSGSCLLLFPHLAFGDSEPAIPPTALHLEPSDLVPIPYAVDLRDRGFFDH